ncbi:restriction endonuclease subunit S [Klebsiella aerogenes]|jgi:type I restriction enzyme S subunit|uniref:restriction endonuclease subunit S n=1 Tax=Enterobacterales TaxID=91347 RepID=UPI002B0E9089|nr:restriction endonuclease subunit S [Klebsiella aerogenes]MEB6601550.1 restriction endonuclease subunit S [Klebsiella aerogenes]HEO9732755.1 restriction endonuclease subunit S [Klebsiella aerogenes]
MTVEKLITDHIDIWSSALQTRSIAGRGSNGKIDLYGIKKLRELILELAVRGKLVPQDPNDEPASELLKRIAAVKAKLVKQGKIKKQKPLPEISEDEKPFELPVGWEWQRLIELGSWAIGSGFPTSIQGITSEDILMCKVSDMNLQGNEKYIKATNNTISEESAIQRKINVSEPGTVIFPKIGGAIATNKRRILVKKTAIDNNCLGIRPFEQINLEWFFLILNAIDMAKYQSGTSVPAINQSVIGNIVIALPSEYMQARIVAKVEELMSLCDQLEQQSLTSLDAHQQLVETLLATLTDSQNAEELAENWARISLHFDTLFTTEASIDALKQTILQLAVMGKLVQQDPDDEPVSELLKRIEQEKEKLVEEGKIKKQKPLPPISEDEKPFELPKGWEWCRIGSVINIRAELVKPENYYDFFQVAPDIIEKGTGKVISQRTVKESGIKGPNSRFYKNQIVYSKIRPSLSKAFIAEYDGLCSADMYPLDCFINTGYLLKVILSEVFLIQVRAAENRIKMPKLNVESLSNILIPVPPAGIQSAVFSKISQMDIFCDTLKSRLQSAQQTQLNLADALTDAALN